MKKLITTLYIALAAVFLSAAPVQYTFRHYSTLNGLSSNTVNALLQDSRGLVWMGTSSGLDCFDGSTFTHHGIPGDRSNIVQSLLEDESGILWVGTEDAVYRMLAGGLEQVPGPEGAVVSALAQGKESEIWIGTYGKGVFRWQEGTLAHYMENGSVEALHIAEDGRVWVADQFLTGGLAIYNAASDDFVNPALAFTGCTPTRVCALDEDSNGDLWAGTWDRGLYRISPATMSVSLAVPPGPGLNHVHSLMHNGALNFLVGSDDGLLEVNPLTGERTLYKNDRSNPGSLSNKYVYPVIRDHEGGLWIGTYYGGVNYVSPNVGQFFSMSLSQQVNAQEDFIVSCFCEDPDGNIWIGSDNGGLFLYNIVSRKLTPRKLPSTYNIHALLRFGDDLWIGTYSENLLRLNLRTGSIKTYGVSQGLDASSVYSLHLAPDGVRWAGTNSGLCRYIPASDRFVLESPADWTADIASAEDGTLWVATSRGGVLIRTADGNWNALTKDNSALPTNSVSTIQPTPRGMFVGTQKGLLLFTGTEGELLLDGIDVEGIAFDGTQLWLTTQGSLLRYSIADGRTEAYGPSDGVNASMFSPNTGICTRDGHIYVGTSDGFISFLPGSIKQNAIPPRVILMSCTASGNGQWQDLLGQDGETHLNWNLRDLSVSFSAPSFSAPEKIRYSYMMEGLDTEWKNIGTQNSLTFSQLPAGRHYRLRIRASSNSDVWSPEEAMCEFSIRQHPLQGNLAISLYVLLAVLLAAFLVKTIIGRMEKKSEMQYERKLDEALTVVKEEERDERAQFIDSVTERLEAPIAGIGIQLEKLKEQEKTLGPVKGELLVIEKNHRALRSLTGYLRQMQTSLSRQEENGADKAPDLNPDEIFLAKLDKTIMDNIANPDLSISFLAQEMAVSRSSLFAKVSELTGETPNKLINTTRLNMAASLLSKGTLSVSEICYMVGFSSPSYFSKIFLSRFGLTPHEWSKRNPT